MRKALAAISVLLLAACTGAEEVPPESPPEGATAPVAMDYSAALADERRPEEDVARDEFRHPDAMMALAELEPGDKIADLLPGGGYFTRVFALAVGPEGVVYPVIRPEGVAGQYETPILPVAEEYPNVLMNRTPYDALAFPEPLDVVFTAQNYHDMHIAEYNMGDPAGMNATAFAALKPGGYYIVIDHSAPDDMPLEDALALHRIQRQLVIDEVTAAGFVLDSESDAVRNPVDPRDVGVFDESIRGHTDQFALRFRKPE